jgi:hypothetical protein
MHAHHASVELSTTCYDWAMRKCNCGGPGCDRVHHDVYEAQQRGSSARCDKSRDGAVGRPLEMVDNHAGTGSRAAHRANARTPVQPTR